jgi:hypothetical protein
MSTPRVRAAVQRRFFKAFRAIPDRFGWDAKQIADNYKLPHRSVLRWLAGKHCPRLPRLKELCRTLHWNYDMLFRREALLEDQFENQHLDLVALNQRYLQLQPDNPLEAWSYVALAGALLFIKLSNAGYECRVQTDHSFGSRLTFLSPKLDNVILKLNVIFGAGLRITWLDGDNLPRYNPMPVENSTLDFIEKTLHSLLVK